MLQKLNAPVCNYNNSVAMTGAGDNGRTNVQATSTPNPTPTFIRHGLALNGPEEEFIPVVQSRIVVFDLPGCAVTNSHYLLCLQQFPLELTLELQSDGKHVCAPGPCMKDDGIGQALSTTFLISDVEAKADLLIPDSGNRGVHQQGPRGGHRAEHAAAQLVAGDVPDLCYRRHLLSGHHAGVLQTQGGLHHFPPHFGQG